MIAITLMIGPHDSPPWLEFVRHRVRRFESPLQLLANAKSMPFSGLRWQLFTHHLDWAVELVLAGAPESLELITVATGVRTALTHIFAATGSSSRTGPMLRESIR